MSGRAWWGLLATSLLGGCSEELGPRTFETTRVSGRLLVGSQPVSGGWVEFVPLAGTVGLAQSARIRPDGSFVVEGVALGINRIGIDGALGDLQPIFRHHFDPLMSPIERPIRSGSQAPIVINLLDEYARWVSRKS